MKQLFTITVNLVLADDRSKVTLKLLVMEEREREREKVRKGKIHIYSTFIHYHSRRIFFSIERAPWTSKSLTSVSQSKCSKARK